MSSEWTGPLLGFKRLIPERVDGELWLRSGSSSGEWPAFVSLIWPRPPDGLQAECPIELQAILHGVPALGCSCGIYATLEPLPWHGGEVPVLVRGWGRVALHTQGWRAERARIEAVLAFEGAWEAAAADVVSQAYGVPDLPWLEALALVDATRVFIEERLKPALPWVLWTSHPRDVAASIMRLIRPVASAPPDAGGGSS
jgi:hypothetical protein